MSVGTDKVDCGGRVRSKWIYAHEQRTDEGVLLKSVLESEVGQQSSILNIHEHVH